VGAVSFDEPVHIVMFVLAIILSGLFLLVWWRDQEDDE
jgi:hypothetical protein